MAGEYTLSVLLKAQDAASSVVQGFLSHLGPIGDVVATVGGALIGVGVQSVTMAANFQESMTQLVTGAGESQKNIALVSNGVLNMAVQVGESTQQLSQGLFMIESSGYHGAAGLQVLQTAAQGAQVGAANLQDVAFTLTGVLHDYGLSASQSVPAMNALIATTQAGKMHMQDLSLALGSVLPIAAQLHVSFPQIGAAIAEMTNSNMTAQRATQNLNNALLALSAPSATAQKAMTSVGLTAQQVKDTLSTQGLSGVLQLIEQHVGHTFPANSVASVEAFKAIMGGATGYKVALMLTGKNLTDFEQNAKNIAKTMQGGSQSVQGWSEVQQDFNFKLNQAKEVVETLMIRIGMALLPVLTRLMNAVMPLISSFSDWIAKSGVLQSMVNGLTSAIMPTISGFIKWLSSGNNLKSGLSLVGGVVQQVGKIILSDLIQPVGHLIGAVWSLVSGIATWAVKSGALSTVLHVVGGTLSVVGGLVGGLINGVASVIGWFAKGSPAALALRDALIAVGAAIAIIKIGNFIATIPALLAQLAAWLAATWAQVAAEVGLAIAEMAANWPIYVIIAAVLLLIGIVILLVKHWGAVIAFLRGAWQSFASWFMGALHTVGAFFTSIWNGIKNFFIGLWTSIVGFFKAHILLIISIVTGPLGALIILIVTHWSQIKAFFSQLWQDVVGIFHMAVSWVENAVMSIWNTIVSIVTTWPQKALQWGKDLIQNLINGILSMVGGIGNAVGSIAGKIASFLHFSKPEVGPLASVMSWMPDFGDLLAQGLAAQKGKLQAAVTTMVQPIASGVSNPSGSAPPLGTGAPPVGGTTASAGGVTNIYLTINSKAGNIRELAKEVVDEISRLQRMSGQQAATASGRRF